MYSVKRIRLNYFNWCWMRSAPAVQKGSKVFPLITTLLKRDKVVQRAQWDSMGAQLDPVSIGAFTWTI